MPHQALENFWIHFMFHLRNNLMLARSAHALLSEGEDDLSAEDCHDLMQILGQSIDRMDSTLQQYDDAFRAGELDPPRETNEESHDDR